MTVVTDVSDASGTGLFDVKRRRWANDLIQALDLPISFFPLFVESHEKTGVIKKMWPVNWELKQEFRYSGRRRCSSSDGGYRRS